MKTRYFNCKAPDGTSREFFVEGDSSSLGDFLHATPAGSAVALTLSANFITAGVQTQLTSTANVRVLK